MHLHSRAVDSGDLLSASVLRAPDQPALLGDRDEVSFAELDGLVDQAVRELDAILGEGNRQLVGLQPSTTVDFVVAWLACLRVGHVALFAATDQLQKTYPVSATREAGAWRSTGRSAPELHPDLRLLLSTSGSTGSAKLVRLSEQNIVSNARAIAAMLELTEADRAVTTLPLDYCYGLSVLHSHLVAGAGVILSDKSVTDPSLWSTARDQGATNFAGVPYTFELLETSGWPELPRLRLVTQAGGRMDPEKVTEIHSAGQRQGWELVVMYGQTEATARMAYLPPELTAAHPDCVGLPIPGGSFRLERDPSLPSLPSDVGELVYCGPNVMMGYAQQVEDLALPAELDELSTGDLARIDTAGIVSIVGRKSRFAKVFGYRIDMEKLDRSLLAHGIRAATAQAKDAEKLVVAVVKDDPDAASRAGQIVSEDSGLPVHAVQVVSVAELPQAAERKVDFAAVAALAQGADQVSRRTARAPQVGDLERRILKHFQVVLTSRAPQVPDSFVSLRGDSLSYVELSVRLQRELGDLPREWAQMSIGALAHHGARRRGGSLFVRAETSILLRALGIIMIVGSHSNVFVLVGGAHILLAVAGANFARFHLVEEPAPTRAGRVLRAVARIFVPSVLWIGGVTLLTGEYPLSTVFLVNELLGQTWSTPEWHYWFLGNLVFTVLVVGLALSIPRVLRLERRHGFALAAGLTAFALVPRWCATWTGYEHDVIHSTVFISWLFFSGWAAVAARNNREKAVTTVLVVAGIAGFTGTAQRDLIIALGVLALLWLPRVPWPRVLMGLTGTIASASLYIYLTHWQVYPHLEDRWPLGGLLASLAVGIATWWLVNRLMLSIFGSSAVQTEQSTEPDPRAREKECACSTS